MKGYTYLQLPYGNHVTLDFGNIDVKATDKPVTMKVKLVGHYHDDDVDAAIVTVDGKTHQPNGTLYHITLATRNGVKPVESGRRATANGYIETADKQEMVGFLRARVFGIGDYLIQN